MSPRGRIPSFAWVGLAYVVALAAAWAVVRGLGASVHPLWAVAGADLAGTIAVFAFSFALRNSSVYDPYWSVAPLVIAPWLALLPGAEGAPLARRLAVCALVAFWGVRLTYNWVRGFPGLHHEDWRYVEIQQRTGRAYWAASFAGIHLFPTVQVYLGCLPLFPALTSQRPLGLLDAVAALVTVGAILIETVADEQLRRFRAQGGPDGQGQIMAKGLWAFSRHPNYFGEVGFWWGLLLFGLAADPGAAWSAAGAVTITAMFVFISIPMLDERSAARRPEYAAHMRRVSALVPWWPKRG